MKYLRYPLIALLAGALVVASASIAWAAGGSISGTVRDGAGTPVQDAGLVLFTAGGDFIGDARSDASGAFSFGGIAATSYKIYVAGEWSGHVSEWYRDARDFSSAAVIDVADGQAVAGLDVVVSLPYSIDGRVEAADGEPIGQARVEVRGAVDGVLVADTSTGDDGTFLITNVPEGAYTLSASADGQGYLPGAYAGNPVEMGLGGSISGASIVLAPEPVFATVSGEVRLACDDGCSPRVQALTPEGDVVAEESFPAGGGSASFVLDELPPGDYILSARCTHCDPGYYGGTGVGDAQVVSLGAGERFDGVSIGLAHGTAVIEGTVRDNAGEPVAGARIDVYSPTSEIVRTVVADASGRYAADMLPSWEYSVRASDPSGELASRYYGLPPSGARQAAALLVSVPSGARRAGVDIVLPPVVAGLAGVIQNAVGQPAAGAWVTAFRDGDDVATAITDGSGRYRMGRLEAGSYQIRVDDPTGEYGFAWLADDASPIELAQGAMAALHGSLKPGRRPTAIAGATSPRRVSSGRRVQLMARLLPRTEGIPVRLMRRAWWGEDVMGTYTTDKQGRVRARIQVYQDLDLYWSFAGDERYRPSVSPTVRVRLSNSSPALANARSARRSGGRTARR